MTKRKIIYDSDDSDSRKSEIMFSPSPPATKKHKTLKPKLKFEDAPPVNSIKDLITLGKSLKFYKNIDVCVLWDILPYLEELDSMIGMKSLKETLFYQIIYYLQNMHSRNKNDEYLHTVITGGAGCGKTSISKIIGKIYTNLGILSKKNNNFTIGYRDDFVAEYLGQTAIKTRKFLEKCLGGVLFIDEVYSLGPGKNDKDSFSKEAIDTLCAFLSEHKNDFCCIVAGYKEEIHKCFLSVNQGLDRRFPWRHDIEEYSHPELAEIFLKHYITPIL
jgi:SpoVK/Ycf46/Vps4 family AAA+-type ATPase